jgi:hypothetical protein
MATNETVDFVDPNFKLLVVEELMYFQKVIQPQFDMEPFAKAYKEGTIDIEEAGYEVIPEARQYFLSIPVKREWLERITSLCQDGGSHIWLQIIPRWSGTTDDFDINRVDDAKMLPNLKKIVLFYNAKRLGILDEFARLGIKASWV